MRILHCIPIMAGGGAERQLVYLSGELVRRGWDVHVALLNEGPNFEGLVATGCVIHKIPARGYYDPTTLLHLVRLVRTIRPDLIQTWITQMDVFGGMAAMLTRTPLVLSERSCASAYPPSIKNRLRLYTGRHANAIVPNSSEGRDYWRIQAGAAVETHVVHNALPLTEIEQTVPSDCDLPIPPHSKMVLFAGRFSQEKNILAIIRAFNIVLARTDAVLLLCGAGELEPRIEEAIKEEGIGDRVFLPGYVRNVWGLMKRADAFIMVSSFEGQPNTVLEAMACGCPLILSDIPAHRAILDDKKASFVDPNSVGGIAGAIIACLDNQDIMRQKATEAKAEASSYAIPIVADQYEKIYQSILSH